jgi:hypothetical protein
MSMGYVGFGKPNAGRLNSRLGANGSVIPYSLSPANADPAGSYSRSASAFHVGCASLGEPARWRARRRGACRTPVGCALESTAAVLARIFALMSPRPPSRCRRGNFYRSIAAWWTLDRSLGDQSISDTRPGRGFDNNNRDQEGEKSGHWIKDAEAEPAVSAPAAVTTI